MARMEGSPRPLRGDDLFILTDIIGRLGLVGILKCFDRGELSPGAAEDGTDVEALGNAVFFRLIDLVFSRLGEAQKPICRLLARLYGMAEEDVQALSAGEVVGMLEKVMTGESFADFFMRAYEFVRRMK